MTLHVAVTGASGNVGLALVRALTDSGHRVTGLCRRPPLSGEEPLAGVAWRALDLTADSSDGELHQAFRGADAVVHLAWGFQPSHRLDYLEELGVGGTRRVARAVAAERVPHLVHMSSVGVYSPRTSSAPVDEDYPREGVPTSPYSQHKATAERTLDAWEREHPDVLVTRMRPGIVGQKAAGSALLRYAVPGMVPARVLRWLPALPLDRRLEVPVVHADDLADAVLRALEQRVGGPFNLSAEPPVDVEIVAAALGARIVHVPARVLRAAVAGAWRARLEQLDPGWIDLAYSVPLLDISRAEEVLGWRARHSAVDVIEEVVEGMSAARSGPSPALRRRTVTASVRAAFRDGPVHRRRRP